MHTRIIAHRGHTGRFPENTLSAFLAAKDSGADAIELDVHLSLDGALVVHHDYYLGHPDNGTGRIHETAWSDMAQLTIGNTERIPTLDQVFEALGGSIHYEIELKGFGAGFLPAVMSLVQRHSLLDSVEFTSPHSFALARVKDIAPAIKTGYFVPPRPDWMDQKLSRALALHNAQIGGASVLHAELSLLDPAFVKEAHAANLIVHAADCNTRQDLKKAFALEVDQLSTNALDLALQLRAKQR